MYTNYSDYKENKISGRYITNNHIEPLLKNLPESNLIKIIGQSVLDKPIHSVQIGTGKIKILMWSQMHGNESTTTKALFDAFHYLNAGSNDAKTILENCTLLFIPILNPDGAELYTRENANNIDLNRDAIDLSQPESIVLREVFNDFKPDYCFNLHDQRTIYAAGKTDKPATVSFLAPAYNEARDINESRSKAISIIVAINNELQQYIPNQVGRFDDTFNGNCVGDTFQSYKVPTILFEAGHFPNDYDREETRKFIFISLIFALKTIANQSFENDVVDKYLSIPQNFVRFNDFILRNVNLISNSLNNLYTFAINYEEHLENGKIIFRGVFAEIEDNELNIGHIELDAQGTFYNDNINNVPEIDKIANFSLGDKIIFENGLYKS